MQKQAAEMDQDLLNDDNRLLRAKEAMKFLGNMSRATFYRNIERGIIPKQRYVGGTPVWRLGDLGKVYEQLPDKPYSACARSSSR